MQEKKLLGGHLWGEWGTQNCQGKKRKLRRVHTIQQCNEMRLPYIEVFLIQTNQPNA